MKNIFDIRPPSPLGDSSEEQIFNAVGQALTEWEQVEKACAQLFAVLVSVTRRRTYLAPAVRAYGCIVSTKSRHDMLREAAKSYFESHKAKAYHASEFKTLVLECSNFANRRNEIAHGMVQRVFVTERVTLKGTRQRAIGIYLMPSFYNPKKFKDEQFSYRYTSQDLIYYRQEFTKLALRVGGFQERLSGKLRS